MKRTTMLLFVLVLAWACGGQQPSTEAKNETGADQEVKSAEPSSAPPEESAEAAPPAEGPAAGPVDKMAEAVILGSDIELGGPTCFLELESSMGGGIMEPALMTLCNREEPFSGRYALTWEQRQIMAESCHGDPECDDTETAWVIVKVKRVVEKGPREIPEEKVIYKDQVHLPEEDVTLRWSEFQAHAGERRIYGVLGPDAPGCESSLSGGVKSIVGPIVSMKTDNYWFCEGAAHPGHAVQMDAVHAGTGKGVSLLDYFSEEDIFKALNADGFVQKNLHEPVNSMKEMYESMESSCEFYFGDYIMKSFAFHHLKGDQVAVRVGLTHGCEAARGSFTQLGFYLPIPDSLRADLQRAQEEGTLMADLDKRPLR